MTRFWIGHQMLGDVLGFCAAAHLYAIKTGKTVEVWFDPPRKDACNWFGGVKWVEKTADMIDCGGDPSQTEWPTMNGVKRFYRFMDPTMKPTKNFDIHFLGQKPETENVIGLITHSNTQGDIDPNTLKEMISEAKKAYPGTPIALIGNLDNTLIPEGVEDRRQAGGDIDWIINMVGRLKLLITPQSGPCFCAAGWRVPMWVYRSRESFWDYTLNYETYRVERWFERKADYSFFDRLYQQGGWDGKGSGPGSDPKVNQEYMTILHKIIRYTPTIRTVLDIGCGDWQLMRHVDIGNAQYLGVDVSPFIITQNISAFSKTNVSFKVLNPILEDIPNADLIVIKDVLQHLPNADVITILEKVRKKARFALITNDYTDQNRGDTMPGGHRPINVLLEPFNLPGVTIFGYIGKQVSLSHL